MYRLILMDVEMPILNGWDAAKILIRLEKAGSIKNLCPIIAHTAYSQEKDIQRCFESGMVDFLRKPASVTDIDELVDKYI